MALDKIDAVYRKVVPVAARVLDVNEVSFGTTGTQVCQSAVEADAVVDMHHRFAFDQVAQSTDAPSPPAPAVACTVAFPAKDLFIAD